MFGHYLLTVLMLLPFALSAQDSNLYHLLDSSDQWGNIYIDKQSISYSENGIEALIRVPMEAKPTSYSYLNLFFRVDCEKGDVTLLKFVLLDANDAILESEEINERKRREELIPDSPSDKLRIFLCTNTSP